jgi:peptidyl-tRNA hydrolase, PTH2 family
LGAAGIAAAQYMRDHDPITFQLWQEYGEPIIVVRANTQEELEDAEQRARARAVPTFPIRDAGRTEVDPGTLTVMAVGPGPAPRIDQVTGKLKLF